MMRAVPHVFTIPSGVPFLPTLADALIHGDLFNGELSEATIYLPTRRAARALAEILAERGGGRAQLLPRIVPLGDVDQAEFELAAGAADSPFEAAEVLPPPIPPLERRLILTRLIQDWSKMMERARRTLDADAPFLVPSSPSDAVALAGDLETLMDALAIEGVPFERIASAVDGDFSHYFEITLEFVRIALQNWPQILADRNASDPTLRRSRLIESGARKLLREKPEAPIVAAGSTGSMPATATLLATIAQLPNAAVVLPGLDLDLDKDGWAFAAGVGEGEHAPSHGHPQTMMRRLLAEHLKIGREKVRVLGTPSTRAQARSRLLSETFRPAELTDSWSRTDPFEHAWLVNNGLSGVAIVEAADEREEALAAAVALREALLEPDRTAALVTPDRSLATRVAAELGRWGLSVEDSAGVPLSETPAGRLARLAAEAAAFNFHPARILAVLAHPLTRLGLPRIRVERAAAALEIGVLRGPAPRPGFQGLLRALEINRAQKHHVPRPRLRLASEDWDRAADLLRRLAGAFEGFATAHREGVIDLVAIAAAHRSAVEALLEPGPEDIAEESVEALDRLFDDLSAADAPGLTGRFVDYPGFFASLARLRVGPARAPDARVRILGLLEARLLTADRVVIGGLDEGVWPPRVETDAFLNRPMRAKIGLAPPEQRIGQTAHDFVQLFGTPDVVVTRAAKRDGAPMVASRFLQRLKAFARENAWERAVAAGERYRRLARVLDEAWPVAPLKRPAPRPDPALFPRKLSVTEIETLVRDPYSIYARHVLKLDALDPIALPPGARDRGTIIHEILGSFAKDHPRVLPENALEDLLQRGKDEFAEIADGYPELYGEWWPRFERLAAEFIIWEEERRRELQEIFAECTGTLEIPLANGENFILRARADRIEAQRNGRFTIIDFKTGAPPSDKEVFAGFAPQLTLEAAMLMQGGFPEVGSASEPPELLYVRSSGGRKALDPRAVKSPNRHRDVPQLIAEHRRSLEGLIARYVAGEVRYMSRPYPKFARKYSDYDHLARVKEWSLAGGNGESVEP